MTELAETVERVARALPPWQRVKLADALRRCPDAVAAVQRGVAGARPGAGVRRSRARPARRVATRAGEPRPTGAGIALALDAAGRAITADAK